MNTLRIFPYRYGFCFALWIVTCVWTPSDVGAQALNSRIVQVQTNMPDAMVYADSVYIGRASDRYFTVSRSAKMVRLIPPDLDSWAVAPLAANLQQTVDDSLTLELNFEYHYRIESVPFAAQVFLETPGERTLLGDTPMLYTVDDPLRGMLLLTKSGYEPLRLTPGERIWNQHYVSLKPSVKDEELAKASWNPGSKSSRWVDFVAGGVALASGVAAIRFKTKADRRYARYERSGDPELRPSFERFDRYAAVALGTMQVGIGVLAVRLVLK